MLKVFSNQLRRIHKQVQDLISKDQAIDAETGLFKIGDYYLRSRKFQLAMYVFRRYLTYYPSGKYASEVATKIDLAERNQTGPVSRPSQPVSGIENKGQELSDVAKIYYNAVSLFSQEKYAEAMKEFQPIASNSSDEEYQTKALFEIGRCYFYLSDFDKCIAHFTNLIQKYPKHPDIPEVLFYVGSSYEKKEIPDKAKGFFNKILTMASDDTPAYRKAKKALRGLEGK